MYQYVSVSSDLPADDKMEYVLDTDSVCVRYSFDGAQCPVKISFENKLDKPLYIDWKRSAVVLNGQSHNYFHDETVFQGASSGYTIQWTPTFSSSESETTGTLRHNESVTFVAPRAEKQTSMVTIRNNFFKLPGDPKELRTAISTPYGVSQAQQYSYAKECSPLLCRSYLTLSTDPSFDKVTTVDNEFWVSHVIQTNVSPTTFYKDRPQVNRFHNSKATGFGTFLAVVALVSLAGVTALGAGQ